MKARDRSDKIQVGIWILERWEWEKALAVGGGPSSGDSSEVPAETGQMERDC